MIHVINDISDPLLNLIKDDPVRKDIYAIERVINNKEVMVLLDNNEPAAVVCVSYQDHIPKNERDLISSSDPTIAIFYTIWSYAAGAGRDLIEEAQAHIKETKQGITNFVTLSPKTETAKRFHMRNGASVYRENEDTVNYKY